MNLFLARSSVLLLQCLLSPSCLSLSVSYSIFCCPPFSSAVFVEFSFIRAIILLTLSVQISTTVDYYPGDRRNYNDHPLRFLFDTRFRRKILRKRLANCESDFTFASVTERILMKICHNVLTIILLRIKHLTLFLYFCILRFSENVSVIDIYSFAV